GSAMTVEATLSDRGSTRASAWTLKADAALAPQFLEQKRAGAPGDEVWRTQVDGAAVTVEEPGGRRSFALPSVAYVGYSAMPAALQMTMMRYWLAHGEPAALPLLRASAEAPPLEIRRVGSETVALPGGPATLTRYT